MHQKLNYTIISILSTFVEFVIVQITDPKSPKLYLALIVCILRIFVGFNFHLKFVTFIHQ